MWLRALLSMPQAAHERITPARPLAFRVLPGQVLLVLLSRPVHRRRSPIATDTGTCPSPVTVTAAGHGKEHDPHWLP
jgi:hypothetical protein